MRPLLIFLTLFLSPSNVFAAGGEGRRDTGTETSSSREAKRSKNEANLEGPSVSRRKWPSVDDTYLDNGGVLYPAKLASFKTLQLSASPKSSTDDDNDETFAAKLESKLSIKKGARNGDDDGTLLENVASSSRLSSNSFKYRSSEQAEIVAVLKSRKFWIDFEDEIRTASWTAYSKIELPRRFIKPIGPYSNYKIKRNVTVLRHAIRLPTEESIAEMKNRLPELHKSVTLAANGKTEGTNACYSEAMKNWRMYEELAKEDVEQKLLAEEGKKEARSMGQRFRIFYKDLLPDKLDASIVTKFTNCPRTRESAFNFIEGLFGERPKGDKWYQEVKKNKENVLKYESMCPAWKKLKKSELNEYLTKNFVNGYEMKNAAKTVAARCNLKNEDFDVDDLLLVYEICSFETAWTGSSPWCDWLSEEQLKILEYEIDLQLHIEAGYSNLLNTKIPCILYNDLMDNLLNNENMKASFYFTHQTSILKFLAFLGLYQDTKISLTKYPQKYDPEVEGRNWRTTYIGCFSTNVSIVLFENEKHEQAIQVRHQERPVHILSCPPNANFLCPLEKFERIFEQFSYENCRYTKWCQIPQSSASQGKKERTYSVGKRRQNLGKRPQVPADAKIMKTTPVEYTDEVTVNLILAEEGKSQNTEPEKSDERDSLVDQTDLEGAIKFSKEFTDD